jgi:type II secretory pathway component PulF
VWNDDLPDVVPAPKRGQRSLTHVGLLAHGIAWGLFLVLFVFVVPRIEALFTDFGVPLPRVTSLAIQASHRIVALGALTLVVFGTDWLIWNAQSGRGESELTRAWFVLMLAAPLLGIALTLVALAPPFFTLYTPLSG